MLNVAALVRDNAAFTRLGFTCAHMNLSGSLVRSRNRATISLGVPGRHDRRSLSVMPGKIRFVILSTPPLMIREAPEGNPAFLSPRRSVSMYIRYILGTHSTPAS